MDLISNLIGRFTCSEGFLMICDSFPVPKLVDPAMAANDSQCIHIPVKIGDYRVVYQHRQDEGIESIPVRIDIVHEALPELPDNLEPTFQLQIEGGRIAVIDRIKAVNDTICKDFEYEASDTILHECGFVVPTWGDGDYKIKVDRGSPAFSAISLILEGEQG